jgi:endoglucanase
MRTGRRLALLAIAGGLTAGLLTVPPLAAAQAATGCSATYAVSNQWPGGFQGDIKLKNTGDAWTSWALKFAFPGGQSVTQGWNGNWTGGSSPTVTNVSYNGSVASGASVYIGFIGSGSGAGSTPTSFSVNGITCGGSTTTPPVTTAPTTQPAATTQPPATTPPTTTPPATTPPTTTPPTTGTPVAIHGQLHVCGTKMCDKNNAAVQLRGVSSMWLNWENTGYAENASALKWMRDNWHLTVIRAAMGVEPSGAYLSDPAKSRSQVETIINNAVATGVYVIVDFHAHEAYKEQAQSVAFFSDLAKRYGNLPNVIWEDWNEPLQVSWTGVIKPYHQAVVSAIRAADPDNIIVLGTSTWSQDVDQAAASPVAGTNLMYTLHFYSCSHGAGLRAKGDTAIRAGLALFITEWGASNADGGLDGKVCAPEAQTWLDWAKANGISWTAWKLSTGTDSTNLLAAGAPVSGGWDNYLHGHASLVVANMK